MRHSEPLPALRPACAGAERGQRVEESRTTKSTPLLIPSHRPSAFADGRWASVSKNFFQIFQKKYGIHPPKRQKNAVQSLWRKEKSATKEAGGKCESPPPRPQKKKARRAFFFWGRGGGLFYKKIQNFARKNRLTTPRNFSIMSLQRQSSGRDAPKIFRPERRARG